MKPDPIRLSLGLELVQTQIPRFRENFARVSSQWKGDRTRVTEVDLAISREILAGLAERAPDDLAVSEEAPMPGDAALAASEYLWVLDPVDGTNNYACGIPCCAISLGLLHRGVPVYGWVYDHGLNCVFHGGPGSGAFQDETPIQPPVPSEAPDAQRLVAMYFPVEERLKDTMLPMLSTYKIRSLGSAALNTVYTATGRLDGVLERGIKLWDIAAAAAIASACGLELHFPKEPLFPVTRADQLYTPFDVHAGSPEINQRIAAALKGSSL